jgi:N-methylhydantoinase A
MTLRRGVDPRRFALLSFGGAAGLHAVEVARELEIPRVIVPTVASVLSAWGMLATDLRYELSRTHIGERAVMDDNAVRAIFGDLEERSARRLAEWFDGPVRIERSAEMRYGEQIFEIDVPLDGLDWAAPDLVSRIHEEFHRRHEELYTYASRDQEVVFVNARTATVGTVGAPAKATPPAQAGATASAKGKRRAWFGGWRETPVYDIAALVPGASLTGPAILEAETTTVVINEGDKLSVNGLGWLDISLI